MLADQFTQIFREEHRTVRDVLFDLVQAFRNRDKALIQLLLHQMVVYTGPHFRYEEEAMYPARLRFLATSTSKSCSKITTTPSGRRSGWSNLLARKHSMRGTMLKPSVSYVPSCLMSAIAMDYLSWLRACRHRLCSTFWTAEMHHSVKV